MRRECAGFVDPDYMDRRMVTGVVCSARRRSPRAQGDGSAQAIGACDRRHSLVLHHMDGFVVVRHGTGERGETWLFLWLAGSAFFLLQSSLLNWIGFRAMPRSYC